MNSETLGAPFALTSRVNLDGREKKHVVRFCFRKIDGAPFVLRHRGYLVGSSICTQKFRWER